MKTLRIITLTGLCLLSVMLYAQENNPDLRTIIGRKNSIDISLGGPGLFASVNYNRTLLVKPKHFINASIGVGTVPSIGGISVPHQLTFNLGKKSSFLELGIGGSYWAGESNASGYTEMLYSYQLCPIIGWRKYFENNLIFRAYVNPLFHVAGEYFIEDYSVVPYLGISLGYRFF